MPSSPASNGASKSSTRESKFPTPDPPKSRDRKSSGAPKSALFSLFAEPADDGRDEDFRLLLLVVEFPWEAENSLGIRVTKRAGM